MSPTTIVRLVIHSSDVIIQASSQSIASPTFNQLRLPVKVRLAFFLIPLNAIDVVRVGRKYLLTQSAGANQLIQIHEVNNFAHWLVRVLAIKFAQLRLKTMTRKKSFQQVICFIDVTSFHRNFHRTNNLKSFEV